MTGKRVYLIIQALLCIGLAALLAFAAIGIYREGVALRQAGDELAWIYTKENTAAAFAPIAPLFFGAVGLLAAGLILGIRDPRSNEPVKDEETVRDLLLSRAAAQSEALIKEQRKERYLKAGGWIAFGLCMIPVVIYLIQPSHFPADQLEAMFCSLLWGILPWTALGIGFLMISSILCGRCVRRQINAARQKPGSEDVLQHGNGRKGAGTGEYGRGHEGKYDQKIKREEEYSENIETGTFAAEAFAAETFAAEASATTGSVEKSIAKTTAATELNSADEINSTAEINSAAEINNAAELNDAAEINNAAGSENKKRKRKTSVIRIVLLAAAAAMIVAGVLNGSMRDVFVKAINLCTECIGLG